MIIYLPPPPPTEIGEDILPYQLKPTKKMATLDFNASMKVERKSKTEIEFDEDTHKAELGIKDQIIIALALGVGLTPMIREWENTKTKESGIVVADSTIDAVCKKFGLM